MVPLYFAAERPVKRDGQLIMVDDDRMRLRPGEKPEAAQGALPHPGVLPALGGHRVRGGDGAGDHPGDAAGPPPPSARGGSSTMTRRGRWKKREGYF